MRVSSLVALAFLGLGVVADTNVTIDDFGRSRIQYSPPEQWIGKSDNITFDRYHNTTTYTHAQGAFATFNFSGGIAFYYMGYGVIPSHGPVSTIEVEFDGKKYEVSENVNPNQQAQQILFWKTGLDVTKQYMFLVRKTSSDGSHDLNVDAMIYTVPDVPGTGTPIGAIVGGVVGGVCVGVLAVGVCLYLRRRRSKQAQGDRPSASEPLAVDSAAAWSPDTIAQMPDFPHRPSLHHNSSTTSIGGKHAQSTIDQLTSLSFKPPAFPSELTLPPSSTPPMASIPSTSIAHSLFPSTSSSQGEEAVGRLRESSPPPYSESS